LAQLIIRKFSDSKFRHADSTACFPTAMFPNQMQRHWPTEEFRLEEHMYRSGWRHLSLLPTFHVFLFSTPRYISVCRAPDSRTPPAL